LGQNENTRSKESVGPSTHIICRHCGISNSEKCEVCNFMTATGTSGRRLITAEAHERNLRIVDEHPELSKWLGVNGGTHAFARLKHFDVTNQVPSDQCMHNYASTAIYQLQELLVRGCTGGKHGFNHSLTRTAFNKAVKKFKWLRDPPSKQPASAFTPKGSLRWTSKQTISFVRASTKVLAPFFDKRDPHWVCWVKKVAYVETAFSTEWDWERVKLFNQQIIEHHELYVSLGLHVTPKWHWESHGPIEVGTHSLTHPLNY
jgi:hypothetical protein